MDALRRQRATLKGSITRIETFLKNINADDISVEDVQVRLAKLEQLFREFETLQKEIESDLAAEDTTEERTREDWEERYYSLKALAHTFLKSAHNEDFSNGQHNEPNELGSAIHSLAQHQANLSALIERIGIQHTSTPVPTALVSDTKLPTINLPTFSGSYEEWPTFSDLFKALVDSNDKLTRAQKLQYLKTSLKGDAISVLKHISISDANYTEAWERLSSKYNKENCIIDAHIRNIVEQPSLSKATVNDLCIVTIESFNALRALKLPTDKWEALLIYIISSKLDGETRQLWVREIKAESRPTFKQLTQFLETRLYELETLQLRSQRKTIADTSTAKKILTASFSSCATCKGDHPLHKCKLFIAMDISSRKQLVKTKSLCYNCLRSSHLLKTCKSSSCQVCKARHHTLLHDNTTQTKQDSAIIVHTSVKVSKCHATLLPTAIVFIKDSMGQDQPCRVILDSGSQATLISEACVQRLNLQRTHSKLQINGVGSNKLEYTRGKVKITVSSRFTNELIIATALILNKVTADLPSQEVSSSYRNFFSNLQKADPTLDQSSKIDVLLGSDVFFDILTDGKLSHPDGSPTAHNSIFGWVIGGNISREFKAPIRSLHTCVDLDEKLQRFWQIEELPVKETLTEEEKQCEAHFLSTHTRVQHLWENQRRLRQKG